MNYKLADVRFNGGAGALLCNRCSIIIEYGFDMHTCSCCGIKSNNWQGKPIVIELDHINGITNDSRIENLRMLCPNCHSQTPNYKNRKNSG